MPWWRLGVIVWLLYGGLLLAVLWSISRRSARLDAVLSRGAAAMVRLRTGTFVALAAIGTTLLAAFVALYCFAGRGFTGDEQAMTWHARMLLAGHLAIPTPAHPEFFTTVSVLDHDGRWFSQYPIGGPALIAVGLILRAAWLVNPVLLGLAAWQLHRFARHAFGESTARGAVLLFALSPFVLVLGATQMNHTPALLFTLVALAELAAWDAAAEPAVLASHAAGIGLAVGAIALVRPLDAALVALPVGVFQLLHARGDTRRLRSIGVQCVAGLVPIAILLWVNARTTGQPLLFGYDAAHGPAHAIGFHVDPTGVAHTPLRGLIYLSGYLMRFDRFLFEWPLPALLIVCAVLARLRTASRWDSLLLSLVAAFLLGYAAYWHNGFFDGPRFLFPVAPVLILYAARAAEAAGSFADPRRQRLARAIVPACVLCAWLVPLPFSSVPGRLASQRDQRTKLKTDVVAQADAAGLSHALVLVPETWRARLLARLRGLDVRQFDAERIVDSTDACALQTALDDDDAIVGTIAARRRARVLAAAASAGSAHTQSGLAEARVARVPGAPDTPRCRAEAAADAAGTMPYAMFLNEQTVSRSGRLAGRVVWARDLGPRDSLLRAEFADRRWYRYRPGRSLDDPALFIPVTPP